jgi:hypothetical protein
MAGGMRLPPDIAAATLKGRGLGFSCRPDGTVSEGFEAGWGEGAYPPPGYLPWNILNVGNGDTYGYYWPIGREDGPPVVCTLMHDAWGMLPVASSLCGCIRLHLLTDHGDVDELVDAATAFGIEIGDIPIPERDHEDEPFPLDGPPWTDSKPSGIEFWGTPSASELLPHDPHSPHLRFVAAKEAVAKRQLAEAEEHLSIALARLPEYAEAMALLAQVHRQQQDHRRTAESLMEAITSPRCFGAWDRKKLLHWLQRLGDDACSACDDPLWRRRHDLTFVDGVKEKDDYRVFEELAEEYHRLGMGVRAVRLRILTGELMGHETVSFRERYGWTDEKYQSLLKADLRRAGLHQRLVATSGAP